MTLPIFLATLTRRSRRAVLSSPIRVVVWSERRSELLKSTYFQFCKENFEKREDYLAKYCNVAGLQCVASGQRKLRNILQNLCSLQQNISDWSCKTVIECCKLSHITKTVAWLWGWIKGTGDVRHTWVVFKSGAAAGKTMFWKSLIESARKLKTSFVEKCSDKKWFWMIYEYLTRTRIQYSRLSFFASFDFSGRFEQVVGGSDKKFVVWRVRYTIKWFNKYFHIFPVIKGAS